MIEHTPAELSNSGISDRMVFSTSSPSPYHVDGVSISEPTRPVDAAGSGVAFVERK